MSETINEEKIISYISSHPETDAKRVATFYFGKESRPSEINPTLYSMARRGILTYEKDGGAPSWKVSETYICKDEILKIIEEKGEIPFRDLFYSFKSKLKKSQLNGLLYSLEKSGVLCVQKDEEGKNPIWSINKK